MIAAFILVCFYLTLWVVMYNLGMVDDLVSEIQTVEQRWLRIIIGVLSVIGSPSVFVALILLSGCIQIFSFFQELWEGYQREG